MLHPVNRYDSPFCFTKQTCSACNGTGLKAYPTLFSKDSGMSVTTLCHVCEGSGFVEDHAQSCSKCHGRGIVLFDDAVEVNVKGGIRNGHSLLFRGVVVLCTDA